MLHASPDAVECQDKWLSPPEPQEGAEEGEVKEKVTDIGKMLFLVRVFEGLNNS